MLFEIAACLGADLERVKKHVLKGLSEGEDGPRPVEGITFHVLGALGADHMKFEHVTENVPENRRAVRAAYLVRGESVRRVLRDLLKPRKDVKLLARTVRAAEIAVGLLLPDALPPDRKLDLKKLDKDSKRELLSFVTAITIDSVALPFRPRHSVVLRRVSQVLSGENPSRELHRLLALATSDQSLEDIEDSKPVVDLLRDLRLVQLGLRSCKPLFAHLSGLSSALAGSLLCVADAIDLFVLEWRNGPELSRQYQQRWYGGDRSQAALSHEFKMAYPTASGKHEVTGIDALKTDDEGEVSVRINAGKSGSALSEDVSAPASDAESSSSGGDDSAPDSVGE
ncbi:hypothetical protein I4F81_004430 [Pyropia yezoensis]|uniref:Uncharacterized protein n=1 Tax=Pyropia yezoensis TaxID=2788 RepID=A0ACC3BVC6_PYRYE|nr:hypothetical protein I4F81_004430 [Neopyropia yezoensis]